MENNIEKEEIEVMNFNRKIFDMTKEEQLQHFYDLINDQYRAGGRLGCLRLDDMQEFYL